MVSRRQALEIAYEALSFILETPALTREFADERLDEELTSVLEEEGSELLSKLKEMIDAGETAEHSSA